MYDSAHRQMKSYYDTRMTELRNESDQVSHYQLAEVEALSHNRQQRLQIECEQTRRNYAYEKEICSNLEATCCKLTLKNSLLDN